MGTEVAKRWGRVFGSLPNDATSTTFRIMELHDVHFRADTLGYTAESERPCG
jgi:hypothetical protein